MSLLDKESEYCLKLQAKMNGTLDEKEAKDLKVVKIKKFEMCDTCNKLFLTKKSLQKHSDLYHNNINNVNREDLR